MVKRVLVIDDDDDIREFLRILLGLEGYVVLEAREGREGLEAARSENPPHVILLDLMMPGMNGWQFLRARGEDPALERIPVLVLTGAGPTAVAREFEVFSKPIDIAALMAAVSRSCQ